MVAVEVQFAVDSAALPDAGQICTWASAALDKQLSGELTIRVVDVDESRQLNATYRHIDKATNVLSFPADWEQENGLKYYGDIAICAEIVGEEAACQCKPLHAHWAHMVIHGVLHLLGYDHLRKHDAVQMETRETMLLALFDFCNPYQQAQQISR